jgi:hypothetical protein
VCDSSTTSTSSRFNANRVEVFALPLLGECNSVWNELNKTTVEFKRCISYKLLMLLSHELCLV